MKTAKYTLTIARQSCDICCEQFVHAAVYPCGHVCCAKCGLNEIHFGKRFECLLCKQQFRKCVIVPEEDSRHDFGQLLSAGGKYYKRLRCCVAPPSQAYVDRLLAFTCPQCTEPLQSLKQLLRHTNERHHKKLCVICLANQSKFFEDMQLYGAKALFAHQLTHPRCLLCQKPQYDQDVLSKHYKTQHCRCEICYQMEVNDSYWATNQALIQHIRQKHITCKHCNNELLGFAKNSEYYEHLLSVHIDSLRDGEVDTAQQKLSTECDKNYTNQCIQLQMECSLKNRYQKQQPEQKFQRKRTIQASELPDAVPALEEHDSNPRTNAPNNGMSGVGTIATSTSRDVVIDFSTLLFGAQVYQLLPREGSGRNCLSSEFLDAADSQLTYQQVNTSNLVFSSDNINFIRVSSTSVAITKADSDQKILAQLKFSLNSGPDSFVVKSNQLKHIAGLIRAFFTATYQQVEQLRLISSNFRVATGKPFGKAGSYEVAIIGNAEERTQQIELLNSWQLGDCNISQYIIDCLGNELPLLLQ